MPVPSIKSACVFCGASVGNDPAYKQAAEDLGRQMAENGIRLVFGAGHVGMMGTVADAVLAGGGEAIGVIPEFLRDRELAHDGLTELHVVDSMHTRKRMMFDLSDAFVVLPGGLGTLEEVFEMITWRQLGRHKKPIILVSTNEYWQPFDALVDRVVENDFAHGDASTYFSTVSDPADAIAMLLKR
ncbi:MAG: TIGR00730 family Rossman fold protein [Alphaproteobacteria bacterium]